jgi:transcriptional regulator NrdR family protein
MLTNIYQCKSCEKKYKHQPSLSRHINAKHNPNIIHETSFYNPNIIPNAINDNPNIIPENETVNRCYLCKYCNQEFTQYQNRWRHQKKCKDKKSEIELLKEEHSKEIEKMKEQLLVLLKKECKMHPKTLQKINKQLMQQNINGNVNNGTINNITNNFNIIQLGEENLSEILSKKEQIMILNKKHQSLNHMIEYVHFNNKYSQFRNIAITNMKDGLAHMYDKNKNTPYRSYLLLLKKMNY